MNIIESAQLKLKESIFLIMKESMAQFTCSPLIYKLFMFIEMLQMIYYIIHPQIGFELTIVFVDYFRQIIQYLQLNYLINDMNSSQTIIIMYTCFGLQVLIVLFMVQKQKQKKSQIESQKASASAFVSYLFKIISFYALLCNTFLSICLINIYISIIICSQGSPYSIETECYQGVNIAHAILASIGFAIYLTLQFLFIFLYTDLKPTSDIPQAQPQQNFDQWKLFCKIAIIVYITVDYKGNSAGVYLIFLTLMFFSFICLRLIEPMHFKRDVFNFLVVCDSIEFAISFSYTLHKYLDQGSGDDIGFYFIVILLPFVYYCNIQLIHKKNQQILIYGIKRLRDPQYIEQYYNLLMYIIDNKDDLQNYLLLEGLLVQHMELCANPHCPCVDLRESKAKDQDDKIWFRLVIGLLEQSLSQLTKAARLHLLASYVYNDRLKNKFKCYYALMHMKSLDLTYREEFSIFRSIEQLEIQMGDEDQKGEIVIDVVQVVKFQKYYGEFQQRLEESVNKHLEFWSELKENNPDILKLYQLGSSITQSVEDVNDTYNKLIAINPNHVTTLKIYGTFQNEVINNEQQGPRILEKAEQILKSIKMFQSENEQDKYGENNNTCIMTCSTELKSLGQIITCNKEIDILGYHKYELTGQYITRIMPMCIANQHDGYMTNFLETSTSKLVGVEREVMCLHKDGFIVPCTLMFKLLPILSKGIRMVSFLKNIPSENYYIIFDAVTFQIMGLTQNCNKQFGMQTNLVFGNSQQSNDFTMETIIQEFKTLQEKMIVTNDSLLSIPFKLTLDTIKFSQQFLIDHSMEQSQEGSHHELSNPGSQLDEKLKLSPFRSQEVKCTLQKLQYERLSLMILICSENDEFGETGKTTTKQQMADKKYRQTKSKTSSNSKAKHNQQVQNEEYINEDRSSVNSVQSSINDDLRRLKDFKAMISEKVVPRTIRTIQGAMLVLTLVLLTTSIVDLILKDRANQQFSMGSTLMTYSNSRAGQISTLLTYSRMLQMMGSGVYRGDNEAALQAYESKIKETITIRVSYVQQLQFDILDLLVQLESMGAESPSLLSYNITQQLITGVTHDYTTNIIDAVRQLMNSIILLKGMNLKEFKESEYITPGLQSFYYLNENGLKYIRHGLEINNSKYLDFFKDVTSAKFIVFLIVMIISIIVLIGAHAIVMPILMNVDKANNRVLSLFGLIPIDEIKLLAEKCDDFLKVYIEDYQERKLLENKLKDKQEEVQLFEANKPNKDQHYFEVNNEEIIDQQQINKDQQFEEEQQKLQLKLEEENRIKQEQHIKKQQQNNGDRSKFRKKNAGKKKREVAQVELNDDERDRVEKLQSTENKKDSTALVKFVVFFLLFTGFFIMQLVLVVQYTANIQEIFDHLYLTNRRYQVVSYRILFGIEDLIQNKTLEFEGVKLQQSYHNEISDIERDVFESFKQFTLTGYTTYREYYSWFNFENMCANVSLFNTKEVSLTQVECESIQNGILQKGLRTSIISLALYANDSLKITDKQTLDSVVNGGTLSTLLSLIRYQRPAFSTLNKAFLDDTETFIADAQVIEIIKFIVLLVSWLILFIIIWVPHLSKLSKQIWQTKGMLNLIPMSIIQKNDKLKFSFLQDNIISMVS